MRKPIAILLIAIIFFNVVGYRAWLSYVQDKQNSALQFSLDRSEYNENDLVKITVPLSDAYQNDWSDYKRVDGEISFDGRIYKYVKEKVEGGQLILMCIPDHQKMLLEIAKTDILKGSLGLNTNKKESSTKFSGKNMIDDFTLIFQGSSFAANNKLNFYKNFLHWNYNQRYSKSAEQPPEVLA